MRKRDRAHSPPFNKEIDCEGYYHVKTYEDIKNINICDECYDNAMYDLELKDLRKDIEKTGLKINEVRLRIDKAGLEINEVGLRIAKAGSEIDEVGLRINEAQSMASRDE